MARSHRRSRCGLVAAWLMIGCGDEVVGYLEETGSGGAEGSSGDGSSGDLVGLVPPGCLADDFEDGIIDPELWYTWMEQDATLEEIGGLLKLHPPSFALWDTGVVGADQARFPFVHGRVRMRVTIPPLTDRPVVIFLQILDDQGALLSIDLGEGQLRIAASIDGVEQYSELFPASPYPAFVAIRAEGALVHFEVSDDGSSYTTLTTRDKPASFEPARALIMGQTYGDDPLRSLVGVDDFEVCVQ